MTIEHEAFGLIEMTGWIGLIDVVDAMSKATNVDLIGYTHGTANSLVVIAGDCKSVLAVLEVGRHVGSQHDAEMVSKLIPHPHPNTRQLIQEMVQFNGTLGSINKASS